MGNMCATEGRAGIPQVQTSWKPVRYLHNDPRTTLLMVMVLNLSVMGGADVLVLIVGGVGVAILFASVASLRGFLTYAVLETACLIAAYSGLTVGTNIFGAIVIGIGFWVSRFALTVTIGIYSLYSISPSELAVALRRLYLPANFVSAVLVMIRFIPTIFAEFSAIRDAMKMRGIKLTAGSVLFHPTQVVQYLVVPLLASVVRIADDLTAAAVIRGLGSRQVPTPLIAPRFRMADEILLLATIGFVALRLMNPVDNGYLASGLPQLAHALESVVI